MSLLMPCGVFTILGSRVLYRLLITMIVEFRPLGNILRRDHPGPRVHRRDW